MITSMVFLPGAFQKRIVIYVMTAFPVLERAAFFSGEKIIVPHCVGVGL